MRNHAKWLFRVKNDFFCSKAPKFLHVVSNVIGKHCPVFVFLVFFCLMYKTKWKVYLLKDGIWKWISSTWKLLKFWMVVCGVVWCGVWCVVWCSVKAKYASDSFKQCTWILISWLTYALVCSVRAQQALVLVLVVEKITLTLIMTLEFTSQGLSKEVPLQRMAGWCK